MGQPYQHGDKHGIHHSIHLSYRMVSQEPASKIAVHLAAVVLERSTFINRNKTANIMDTISMSSNSGNCSKAQFTFKHGAD